MAADDPTFFLKLASMNLERGEEEVALTCLESASARAPTPEQKARVEEAARTILELAERRGADPLVTRARALLEPRSSPGQPGPAPVPTSSPDTVDLVRRLLVSPELVDRLKSVVGRGAGEVSVAAPSSMPIASIVVRLLAADLELSRTAEVALGLVVEATRADRGFLILERGVMRSFTSTGGLERPPQASEGVLREVARTKRSVLVMEASDDPRFSGRTSIQDLRVRSVLCVPILEPGDGGFLGSIYLDAPSGGSRFGETERELAESLAAAIAPALRNACRFEVTRLEAARLERSFAEAKRTEAAPRLLGESVAIKELEKLMDRVARGEHTVLIEGESGSGKELVARNLHARSDRASGPFIAENVGALASSIVEAELFGHAKGAFTGAERSRPGLFQLAHGGTLFLDEVGEMSEDVQRKLLRVLQERTVRPVGGSSEIAVDVRVLAATHRNIFEMAQEGRFREDLYYRLGVVKLRVPPLRERVEDVPLLLRHFVELAARKLSTAVPPLSAALIARASRHSWPGNVRELEAFATRLVLEGPEAPLASGPERAVVNQQGLEIDLRLGSGEPFTFRAARDAFDRAYLALVLKRFGGNVSAAASALELSRSYASELVKRFELKAKASD